MPETYIDWATAPKDGSKIKVQFKSSPVVCDAWWDKNRNDGKGEWMVPFAHGKSVSMKYARGAPPVCWWRV